MADSKNMNEGIDTTEGTLAEDEIAGQDKRGFGKKILLIIIPVFLLLLGAGLYFKFEGDVGPSNNGQDEFGQIGKIDEDTGAGGVFYALPDIIVNLVSDAGSRFLKLRVQLELNHDKDLSIIEVISPRVIDQFQTYLREMRVEDLRGSAGIYRLRQELLYRVNLAAYPVKAKDVLFQEILIQ